MRIITTKPIVSFYETRPDAREALERWVAIIRRAEFTDFNHLRQVFPSADLVGKATVFNISGNKYRLISAIHYNTQRIYVMEVMTHGEYSKETWKRRYQVLPGSL